MIKKLALLALAGYPLVGLAAGDYHSHHRHQHTDDALELYMRLDLSVQSSDEGKGAFTESRSNDSYGGATLDLQLTEETKFVFLMEWNTDFSDIIDSDNLSARNQYFGFESTSWGSLLVGRYDSALKRSQATADQFNHYEADIRNIWAGENWINKSLTYTTPEDLNGGMSLTYAIGEGSWNGFKSVSFWGGKENPEQGQWYSALALDYAVRGYDVARVITQTKIGNALWGFGAQYQQETDTHENGMGGALISVAYEQNNITLKSQLQSMDNTYVVSFGADVYYNSVTKFYFWYTNRELERTSVVWNSETSLYESSEDGVSQSWLGLGMEYNF